MPCQVQAGRNTAGLNPPAAPQHTNARTCGDKRARGTASQPASPPALTQAPSTIAADGTQSFLTQATRLHRLFCQTHGVQLRDTAGNPEDEELDLDDEPRTTPKAYMSTIHLPTIGDMVLNPKRTQHLLMRVRHNQHAADVWKEEQWAETKGCRGDETDLQLLRARYLSISSIGACTFLTAAPTVATRINKTIWSIMLRRHLGLDVYDDTAKPLWCPHCNTRKDAKGRHATESCRNGWSQVHRHGSIQRVWAYDILRRAGCATSLEEQLLIPGTRSRPADVYVPVPLQDPNAPSQVPKPIAFDVTVRTALSGEAGRILKAATTIGGAADQGEKLKYSQLCRKLRAAQTQDGNPFVPHWEFVPIGFDSFGAMGSNSRRHLKKLMPQIAKRSHTTLSAATNMVYTAISYSIWVSAAVSVLSRQPTSGTALCMPPERIANIF